MRNIRVLPCNKNNTTVKIAIFISMTTKCATKIHTGVVPEDKDYF